MDINKIIRLIDDVKPYDKGTAVMWTDNYISKQLLKMHVDPDNNLASRNEESIHTTINWLLGQLNKKDGAILDLGCGPGLYTEKLAMKGYEVTGVDFSKNSIDYAKNRAAKNQIKVNYMQQNYLELDMNNQFDLIIMIYCDFGVLSLEERDVFLKKVYKALKPGGIFIFDALNDTTLDIMKFGRKWECSNGGFWQDKPYICLSETRHFEENQAILDQHIVIDEDNEYKIYRFWNHYFDQDTIADSFHTIGFQKVESFQNLLLDQGICNSKDVTFYKVTK